MIPRDDVLRMAREAGINLTPAQFSGVLEDEVDEFKLAAFAALVAAHVLALGTLEPITINTADLDPALLRDMLAKAPPMPLLPEPAPPDVAAAVAAEREARKSAQQEAVDLKERLARADAEKCRAVLTEREACATLVEAEDDGTPWCPTRRLAAAIRARGTP